MRITVFLSVVSLSLTACRSDVLIASSDCQSLLSCDDEVAVDTPITDGTLEPLDQSTSSQDLGVDGQLAEDSDVRTMDLGGAADMWVPPCPPIFGDATEASDWAPQAVFNVGRPAEAGQVMSLNLDADTDNIPEFLVVSEGSLSLFDAVGKLRWKTGALGIETLQAVVDMDGNGSLEIIATGPRVLVVLAGLTGESLWTMPSDAFGDAALSAIGKVIVDDLDQDGLPELYFVNGGCGDSGNGAGLVYSYQNGRMTRVTEIFGNRANGRCGSWQTVYDTDGDGRLELLVPDGNGLNAFSTATGEKRICGEHSALPNGPNPTLFLSTPSGPAWLMFSGGVIHRLEIQPSENCPSGQSFASVWRYETAGSISLAGSGLIRDRSGVSRDLYLNLREPNGSTSVWSLRLSDGQPMQRFINEKLLGIIFDPVSQTNYALTQGSDADENGVIKFYRQQTDEWALNQAIVKDQPAIVTEPINAHTTRDFRRPIIFGGADAQLPSVAITSAHPSGVGRQLEIFALDGTRLRDFSEAFSSTFIHQCRGRSPCTRSTATALQGVTNNGLLMTIPFELDAPVIRHFNVLTGYGQIITIETQPGHLGVLTEDGALNVYREVGRGFSFAWRRVLGMPQRGTTYGLGSSMGGRSVFIVRDPRWGQTAWSAFDADDGTRLWTHMLNDSEATVFNPPVLLGGADAVFLRMDYSADNVIPSDPACPETMLPPGSDFFAPHPNCPEKAVRSRVITALEPITGRCRWRRVFKADYPINQAGAIYGCPGPTNQRLSVVPAHEGRPAVGLVTESMTLRSFSLTDGPPFGTLADFQQVHVFGQTVEGYNVGGGNVTAWLDDPGYLLFGGATPPILFDDTLSVRWAAADPGVQRPQSWIGQQAVRLGDWVWTSASGGYPLMKLNAETGALAQLYGLEGDEAVPIDNFSASWPNISEIKSFEIGDDRFLTVVTQSGTIFFFTAEGEFDFAYEAATPIRSLSALNFSARSRLLHVTGGGQVVSIGPSLALAPSQLLEVDCPGVPTCDEGDDIDETTRLDRVCLAWTPVEDAIGYEVGLESTDGVLLSGWKSVSRRSLTELDNLSLIPGQTYVSVVRALYDNDGVFEVSKIVRSDGILAINSEPPVVTVVRNQVGQDQLRLTISAQDDDQLATWKMDVLDPSNGQLIERVGSGPLGAAQWTQTFELRLERFRSHVPPYEVIEIQVSVTDRSGNDATEAVRIELVPDD